MGIQKRRHSRSRVAKGRSQWKAGAPTIISCPQCHQPAEPHRVCPSCGYYAGRQVLKVNEEE